MKKIRKTLTGTEYWDTKAKKTLFVPKGKEIKKENDTVIEPDFTGMTVAELKEYAVTNEIEIPSDIKKKEDLVNFLTDQQ